MVHRINRGSARPLGGMLLAAACLLAACGGGGDSPGTEAASSYTEGEVTGYGSIVVNDVRYDDRAAAVLDEDGRAGRRSDVKIGMWVEIEGADVDRSRGVGRALRVNWANTFVGPVSAVDAAAGTFELFGQTIEVRPATQFEGLPAGLADVEIAQVLQVHGFFNAATSRYVATRVESDDDALVYRLRGIVSELDTTGKTFRLGTETIDYAAADPSVSALSNGLRVRVRLQTVRNASGAWVATAVKHGVREALAGTPGIGSRGVGDLIDFRDELRGERNAGRRIDRDLP